MTFKHLPREPKSLGHWSVSDKVAKVLIQHIDPAARNTAGDRSVQRLTCPQYFFGTFAFGDLAKHDYQAIDITVFPQRRRAVVYVKERTIFADKNILEIHQYLPIVQNLETSAIFGGKRRSICMFIMRYIVHFAPA